MHADPTPLDRAHAAMQAAPEDDATRLAFYGRLAEAELYLLLEDPAPLADALIPRVFPLEDGPVVLAFDREARLAAFTGAPADYAALSGRRIAAYLAGQGLTLGLNLGVAPSSILIPPGAIAWLSQTLTAAPVPANDRPMEVSRPADLPGRLLSALDAKLATAAGLAGAARLARVHYEDGRSGHLLAFTGVAGGAEPALAQAVGEALTFSGVDAASLDIAFLPAADPLIARLDRVALRFDLPEAPGRPPPAPGSDPARPPRLR